MSYRSQLSPGYIAQVVGQIERSFDNQQKPAADEICDGPGDFPEASDYVKWLKDRTPEQLATDKWTMNAVTWASIGPKAYGYFAKEFLTTDLGEMSGPGVGPMKAGLWVHSDAHAQWMLRRLRGFTTTQIKALSGYCELYA